MDRLTQTEISKTEEDDDNESDKVDDLVHGGRLLDDPQMVISAMDVNG